MANEQNLKSLATRSQRERTEIARKGQKASAQSKREAKLLKEEIAKRLKAQDYNEIVDGIIERAKIDNKAFEILRDTLGQKPKETVEVLHNDESIKEMERYFDNTSENS